jgi:hypothetical protein
MLLLFGGFMYLDEKLQHVGTNAVAAHSITPGAEIDGAPLVLEKSADLPKDVAALEGTLEGMYHFWPTTVQLMRYVSIQITPKSRLGMFQLQGRRGNKILLGASTDEDWRPHDSPWRVRVSVPTRPQREQELFLADCSPRSARRHATEGAWRFEARF